MKTLDILIEDNPCLNTCVIMGGYQRCSKCRTLLVNGDEAVYIQFVGGYRQYGHRECLQKRGLPSRWTKFTQLFDCGYLQLSSTATSAGTGAFGPEMSYIDDYAAERFGELVDGKLKESQAAEIADGPATTPTPDDPLAQECLRLKEEAKKLRLELDDKDTTHLAAKNLSVVF